jgi:mRNA interferase MazF
MNITAYSLVLVNLDPTIGSEIKKTRPCVVLSPDEMNEHLRTVVIAPVTNTVKNYPTRVRIKHPKVAGSIAIDQIRTIDRQRVIRVLGKLSPALVTECKAVIREAFVD